MQSIEGEAPLISLRVLHAAAAALPPPLPPSSASPVPPPLPSSACVLPILVLAVLLGRAQRQGKLTDASIIHRSPPLSLCLPLVFPPHLLLLLLPSAVLCVFTGPEMPSGSRMEGWGDCCPPWMAGQEGKMACMDDRWINEGCIQCWFDWQGGEVPTRRDGSKTGLHILSVPFSRRGSDNP